MSYATVLEAVRIAGLNNKAAGEVFSYLAVNSGTATQLQSALQQMGACWAGGAERLSWDIANLAGYAEIRAALVSCGAAHDGAADLLAYELSNLTLTPPGSPALWYDAQNIDGTNNGSLVNLQTIGTWKNLGSLGAAGDVLQATAGLKPQYVAIASGGKLNNKSCVRSDGTRTMQSGALTTLNQPTLVAVVAMTTTIAGGICDIVDGRTAARNILGRNGAPFLGFAGSFVTPVGNFVANTYHGLNLNFNGAASIGRFDGAASGAVNPGAGGLDGVTLFSDLAAGSLWTGDIIELLVYNGGGQPTAAQVEAYFTTRYGATPQ
jgi:hypothetical protein